LGVSKYNAGINHTWLMDALFVKPVPYASSEQRLSQLVFHTNVSIAATAKRSFSESRQLPDWRLHGQL
jgi:hypothetical protein